MIWRRGWNNVKWGNGRTPKKSKKSRYYPPQLSPWRHRDLNSRPQWGQTNGLTHRCANHDTEGKRFKSLIHCCDVTKPPYLFSGEIYTSPLHCKLLFVYTLFCRRTGQCFSVLRTRTSDVILTVDGSSGRSYVTEQWHNVPVLRTRGLTVRTLERPYQLLEWPSESCPFLKVRTVCKHDVWTWNLMHLRREAVTGKYAVWHH